MAEKATRVLADLEAEFGLPHKTRVNIILASSESEFRQALPGPGFVPSWAAGAAYPAQGLIVLKTPQASPGLDLDRVLKHELAHLVLGRIFDRRPVPVWLNEGLTMHLVDDWSLSRQMAMARAMASGGLISLHRLVREFPEGRLGAETAYAESYYFIAFLRDRYGGRVVGRLIGQLGAGIDPERALYRVTGLTDSGLQDEFERWLSRRFSIIWLLAGPWFLWFLGALLVITAVIRRKRAAARKLAEWEQEEDGPETGPVRTRGRSSKNRLDRTL
ncbi:MAG: peptidase MA family metallohydrolase [Pseudomonadota bacterium]